MSWIRRHIRSGAWLALTAFALHLVLTFGHVHREQSVPVSIEATSDTGFTFFADSIDGNGTSEHQNWLHSGHDLCAVCASINLLGTSVLPMAQSLDHLLTAVGTPRLDFPTASRSRQLSFSFKARAPPSA